MKRIEIIINPQGKAQLETTGFEGNSCQQASRFLEEALGTSQAETLTSEFYLRPNLDQPQREHS